MSSLVSFINVLERNLYPFPLVHECIEERDQVLLDLNFFKMWGAKECHSLICSSIQVSSPVP